MLESEVEDYLKWTVEMLGGKTWKWQSPGQRGVADRIVCLPDGRVWFIELKRPKGGRLSALQRQFGETMVLLRQNYAVLWSKEMVDEWKTSLT